MALLGDESVSVVTVGTGPTQPGDPPMRIYIISSDGITLCREPPAPVSEGEIVVASNEELPKSPMAARLGWSSQDGETLGGAALRHAA